MARSWIAGKFSLDESDEAEWMTEMPPEELLLMRYQAEASRSDAPRQEEGQ